MVARASVSQSVSPQPKWAIAGPTASDGSATRPVTTTWAPARSALRDRRCAEVGVGADQLAAASAGARWRRSSSRGRGRPTGRRPPRPPRRIGETPSFQGDLPNAAGGGAGVGRAEVADDGDAVVQALPQDRPHHALHERGVAAAPGCARRSSWARARVRSASTSKTSTPPDRRGRRASPRRARRRPSGRPRTRPRSRRQRLAACHSFASVRVKDVARLGLADEPVRVVGEQEPLPHQRVPRRPAPPRRTRRGRGTALPATAAGRRPASLLPSFWRTECSPPEKPRVVALVEPVAGDVPAEVGAQRRLVQDRRDAADLVAVRIHLRDEARDDLPDDRRLERHPTRTGRCSGSPGRSRNPGTGSAGCPGAGRRGSRGSPSPVIGPHQLAGGEQRVPARRRGRVVRRPSRSGRPAGPASSPSAGSDCPAVRSGPTPSTRVPNPPRPPPWVVPGK